MSPRVMAVLGTLAGCVLTVSCQDPVANASQQQEEVREPGSVPETVAAPSDQRVRVRTVEIEASPFVETLEVTGTLAAWHEVHISSELGGLVREVLFDEGDRVKAGALLARVGDDLARARLAQAQAELTAAEANFGQIDALFARQAVPRDRLISATAELERATAAVHERELIVERALIRTPIDGIATMREIEPGEVIAPSTRITTVTDISRLKVEASVPDTEIGWLARGRTASVSIDAFPGRSFPAEISFVAPAARAENRSFPIKLELDNQRLLLRPGMVARVRMDKRRVADVVVVPVDALVTRTDGLVAFVVRDCTAELRMVRVAAYEGEQAMISEGLATGDALVVDGQADLSNGQAVLSESCP